MTAYRRDFDETKHMLSLLRNEWLLEKYNAIWKKVSNNIKKRFDSEAVHN